METDEGQFAKGGCVKESAGAEQQQPHQRQVFFYSVASVSVTTLTVCCRQEVWQKKKTSCLFIVDTFNVIKNVTTHMY